VRALAFAAFAVLAPGASLLAQSEPGSELTVTLLTYETGGRVWERFGHNAILIHDAATGSDHHYDYGRFDFGQAHFFFHFAQGRMWYSMGDATDPAGIIAFYAAEGRKIWAQELDLTPAQRVVLRDFLAWNIRPENAGYAYNYYFDNCSTRIRDALDKAVGGAIRRSTMRPSGFTWRDETRRLDENNVFLYTGLMALLGEPVDVEMSRWEQMFLPGRVREQLDSVRITGPDGVERPLVKSERILAAGGRWPVPGRPSRWTWRYLGLGVILGGLLGALGRSSVRGLGVVYLAVATLWELVAGVVGLIITWLWAFSSHMVAHWNENILLFNVLSLALAIALPMTVRGKLWAEKAARRLALGVTTLAALALLIKLWPAFHQSNLDLIALALPAHAGVLVGLRTRPPS
jgi:hypothetical protein